MKSNLFMSMALSLVSAAAVLSEQPQQALAKDASVSQASEFTSTAKVGQAAPAFTLEDADGKKHSLNQYKNKLVVLEWVNFGCPFVKKHYDSDNMQKLQEAYTKKGVIWLSICSSNPDAQGYFKGAGLKKEIEAHHSKATAYLVDADGTVGHEYGAKSTPDMFVIDKEGTLVYAGAIDDKATTDVKDVASAKNYVKEALEEVIAGKKISTTSTKSYGCSVKYGKKTASSDAVTH
jgi:peroxiredoxin